MPRQIEAVAAIGAIVLHNNAVLLVKRKNPPCANQWAIPGGRIHAGETLQQAAEREIFEETGIRIKAGEAVFSFDLIEYDDNNEVLFHYVIIDVEAKYIDGEPTANDDALDAAWINPVQAKKLNLNATTKKLLVEKYHF